ncbi:MAG: hypothetical protein RDU59_12235 [Thermodesulfobacteriota bacterium]|nr:hypothetical protein [Thermodesulfobacteriota bacterium]
MEEDDMNPEMALTQAFDTALEFNVDEVKAYVSGLKDKYTGLTNEELAQKVIRGTKWKTTLTGAVTGAPSNPWVSVGAAAVDVGILFRCELGMAARIATIFDETFFDEPDAQYELLIPLFGGQVVSQLLREAGVRAGMGVTRAAIRKFISKEVLKIVKKLALKYLGLKLTQRAIITKTLPIVGGVIGGAWNHAETSLVGKRVIDYFNDKAVSLMD